MYIHVVYDDTNLHFFVQPGHMHPDADEYTVSRCLEAYLLRLFGWVMFCGSMGFLVDKGLIYYARAIADALLEAVPQFNWGSAVLAATYRGLTDACTKTGVESIITGCPLLIQICSYERVGIGRPIIDHGPYGCDLYEDGPVDRPTMGTIWCRNSVSINFV